MYGASKNPQEDRVLRASRLVNTWRFRQNGMPKVQGSSTHLSNNLPYTSLSSKYLSVSRSVQSLSHIRLFATPWIAAHQASLSITNSRSLPTLMSIESVMPSSHLILCRSLLLLPPNPPRIRVFSNESTLCMRWPKYRSFSFNITPSQEHPGLISFRMDWLISLQSKGLSRVFSNTTIQNQFLGAQLSL